MTVKTSLGKFVFLLLVAAVLSGMAASAATADTKALKPAPSANVTNPATAGFMGIPSYYSHLDFNLTGPGAYTTAAGGYANPAVYAMMPGDEMEFYWTVDDNTTLNRIDRWGIFVGLQNLGFGVVHNRLPGPGGTGMLSVTDYRLGLSGGTRNYTFGAALGWSGGDTEQLDRSTVIQVGSVFRFNKYTSAGLAGIFSTQRDHQSGLADLAIRPLGDERFTLFGDVELPRRISTSDAPWSAGAMVELIAGVRLIGRYFDDESFALTLAYSAGGGVKTGSARAAGSWRFDKDAEYAYSNYGIRMGFPERNVVASHFQKNRYYLSMNLGGPIVHSRFKYFDSGQTLKSVLDALEDARVDPRVKGVALNLSGSRMSQGMAWEIREKLEQIQKAGKHVVVFVDEVYMPIYYVASVADRIVQDPEGIMILSGYVMGRTYLVNLLEKLGIGFDEWRFLKYKSAVEFLSRHSMSDADREQRQALVDGYYQQVRDGVTRSRRISGTEFDRWVNDLTLIGPAAAMREGIVDTLGSWEDVKDVIAGLEGSKKPYLGPNMLAGQTFKSTRWGEPPQIAVVYALGECDMDKGINARRLERIFQRVRVDQGVKAVVFRVNSPGGSAMASDVVARALKKCSHEKPVIVSQAEVAASGGYWISMNADTLLAQPTTITGSIGVIGGWVWNNGLGDKVGLEGDFVKKGEHADLFFGLTLPFMGISIPHRALTQEERDQIIGEMKVFYDGFVEKVAMGRSMKPEEVEEVAQGRVWTGLQGKKLGLIDEIGGLETACAIARERAGIAPNEEVNIVEYGTRGWFNFAALNPLPFSIPWGGSGGSDSSDREFDGAAAFSGYTDLYDGYEIMYLKEIVKNNGRALCLIPPDYLPRGAKSKND